MGRIGRLLRMGRGGAVGGRVVLSRERQLKRLMLLRVVLVTTLLLAAVSVEAFAVTLGAETPLYLLIVWTYVLTLLYALGLRLFGASPLLIAVQATMDLLLVTGIIYVTGGAGTGVGFAVLYPLSVLAGSVLLDRRVGLLLAGLATTGFAALIAGIRWQALPPRGLGDIAQLPLSTLLFSVLLLFVSCSATALTGGWFSEGLRAAGERLDEAAGRVADLQELNTLIVDSIMSGLMITDLHGRVQFLNRVGARILDLREGQAEGRLAREFLGSWLDAGALDARARRRELARGEAEYVRADGALISVGVSVSPLVRRGPGEGGYLLVFQDLTEVKNLEAQVRTHEKLAAVGEVAAQLAHEIRNPLGAIHGSAQLLLGDGDDLSEDQAHLLEIIRKESQRLSENLNQFLVQARGPSGNLEPVDLGPVIGDAVALLRNSPEVKPEHNIEVAIAPGPLVCLASADRIRQVFWNLARNALEAMPAGGRLSVSLAAERDRLTLTVRDEGFGPSPGRTVQAFAPLPARPGARVGLGLAIVFQIVREHHGDIAFQRMSSGGTAVRVFLPLVGADVAA